jgi:hypothetical protein
LSRIGGALDCAITGADTIALAATTAISATTSFDVNSTFRIFLALDPQKQYSYEFRDSSLKSCQNLLFDIKIMVSVGLL